MPKLKKTLAEIAREREQNEIASIGRIIGGAVRYSCGSARKASEHMDIKHTTLCRRIRNPEELTVAELRMLAGIIPEFDKDMLRSCIVP